MFNHLSSNLSILSYHSIGEFGADPENVSIKPHDFENQIEYLHDANYSVLPLAELLKTKPSKRKCVAITFDGGFRDSLVVAKEILDYYDFKASLFIPTAPSFNNEYIGHYTDHWGILNETELLLASMNFDIYPSGHSGLSFLALTQKQRMDELKKCRELLEEISPNPNFALSLPHNQYNQEILDDIIIAGFEYILGSTANIKIENSPVIHRIPITGNDAFASFVSKLHRLPNWIIKRMKNQLKKELDEL